MSSSALPELSIVSISAILSSVIFVPEVPLIMSSASLCGTPIDSILLIDSMSLL